MCPPMGRLAHMQIVSVSGAVDEAVVFANDGIKSSRSHRAGNSLVFRRYSIAGEKRQLSYFQLSVTETLVTEQMLSFGHQRAGA
jgi:hypothetical protein